jgi:hypothetical protein
MQGIVSELYLRRGDDGIQCGRSHSGTQLLEDDMPLPDCDNQREYVSGDFASFSDYPYDGGRYRADMKLVNDAKVSISVLIY